MSAVPTLQTPTAAWQQLITLAVLGTDRAGRTLPALTGRHGEFIAALPGDEPERKLLACAGVLTTSLDAGQQARAATGSAAEPCPPDTLPPCSPRASDLLKQVLRDHRDELLGEWCQLAAQAGCRVPEELLARLLDAMARIKDHATRTLVMRVAGQRGCWLAARNPRWSAGCAQGTTNPADTWQSGTSEERLGVLGVLRRSDPAQARALISGTWADEPPDMREPIIQALAAGLSMEDEPFLEAALDDKRKAVRTSAAGLLAALPESRLCQRMIQRITPLLQLVESKSGLLRRMRKSLEVTLPGDPDKSMLRDGLEAKARGKMGAKAVLLLQMLAATPLEFWTRSWQAAPEEIIRLASATEWKDALIQGWTAAACAQHSTTWSLALLTEADLVQTSAERWVLPADYLGGLVAGLEPAERERITAQWLEAVKYPLGHAGLMCMLDACRHAWSASFSRSIAQAMYTALHEPSNPSAYLQGWIQCSRSRMEPGIGIDELGASTPARDGSCYPPSMIKLLDTLSLRRDYMKELRS